MWEILINMKGTYNKEYILEFYVNAILVKKESMIHSKVEEIDYEVGIGDVAFCNLQFAYKQRNRNIF